MPPGPAPAPAAGVSKAAQAIAEEEAAVAVRLLTHVSPLQRNKGALLKSIAQR